jgi:hypothetical protein
VHPHVVGHQRGQRVGVAGLDGPRQPVQSGPFGAGARAADGVSRGNAFGAAGLSIAGVPSALVGWPRPTRAPSLPLDLELAR